MAGPTLSTLHGDPRLQSLIAGFPEEQGLIATQVAPIMTVPAESGTFYAVDYDYGRRNFNTRRAPGGAAPMSAPPLSTASYGTREYAHKTLLEKRKRDNAMLSPDGFKRIRELYARQPSKVVLLDYEVDAATAMAATASYFSASHYTTLTGTDQWSDPTNSNPQDDVLSIGEAIEGNSNVKMEQLTGWCDSLVYHKLRVHPHVKDQVKYVQKVNPDDIGPAQIASYLGIKNLVVSNAKRLTSNPGASTEVVSRIWGKHFYLGLVEENPSPEFGVSASWVTAAFATSVFPRLRTERSIDPEGEYFFAEGNVGITKVQVSTEGIRTAGVIKSCIA